MRRELMTSLLALLTVGVISCILYFHHINNLKYSMQTDRSFRELQHLILQLEQKKGVKYALVNLKNFQTRSMRSDSKRITPQRTKSNNDIISRDLGNVSSGISGDERPMKGTGDSRLGDHRGSEVNSGVGGRKRYLVYLCDSRYACSGWGDRQRGVVAAYLLSVVTNREFVVNMTSPCNVRKFLEPNQYNWDLPASELAGKSSVTIGGVRDTAYHKMVRYRDVNRVLPQDIIYLRSSADLINAIKANPHYKERIPNWTKTRRHVAFKNGWKLLMKPTKHLQNHIDNLLRTVNLKKEGSLVCAHVRIGKNPSVPNDSPNRNSVESVESLWDFLDHFVKNASRIFIATDSLEIREMARKRFGKKSLDSGGEILHIDRQRKRTVACDGFETVILEQMILTKCHVLVVSASNFSIRAAFLRESRTLPDIHDLGQHIQDTFQKLLHNLDDTDAETAFYSKTIAGMFKKVKLLDRANLSVYGANCFMKCLGNCLHVYDDHAGLTADSLMSTSNSTVDELVKTRRPDGYG